MESARTAAFVGRVAEAAARAFGTPVWRFEPEPLAIDPRAMVFEFIEPVQALDVEAWLVPLLDPARGAHEGSDPAFGGRRCSASSLKPPGTDAS